MLQHYLDTRFESWFRRRASHSHQMTFGSKNVYIFFSKEGLLYAFLLLITFLAGINYANNMVLGLCFLLSSLLVITIYYTFAHLSGLHVKLIDVANTQVGGKVQVRIELSSSSKHPHRQIRLSFSNAKNALKQPLESSKWTQPQDTVLVNQVLEPTVVSLWIDVNKRGRFDLPKLTVSTSYPLGILQAWSYVFFDGVAWVYPAPLSYDMKASQYVMSQSENEASLQTKSGQEDFDQLESYVAGESLARVSWAHLARGQGLLSKRFVDTVGQQQLLDYYQMPAVTHEEKLSQLRYGVDKLGEQQIAFRLRLPDGEGVLGQGKAFVEDSLLRLAKTP